MWSWIKRQFCSHKWEVRAAVIGHPRRDLKSAKRIDDDTALRLMLGETTARLHLRQVRGHPAVRPLRGTVVTWTIVDEGVYSRGRFEVRESQAGEDGARTWRVFASGRFCFSSESASAVIDYVDARVKREEEAS